MNIITTIGYIVLGITGLLLNVAGVIGTWWLGAAVLTKFLFS